MIHCHNVAGKKQGAQEHRGIAPAERQRISNAQQVQSNNSQRHAQPDLFAHLAAQQQGDDGDNDYIHRGDESCFCGGRVGNAHLLGGRSHEEEEATGCTAHEQGAPLLTNGCRALVRAGRSGALGAQKYEQRKQRCPGQPAAGRQKCESSHIFCAYALRHESAAPDQGSEYKKQGISNLFGVHR